MSKKGTPSGTGGVPVGDIQFYEAIIPPLEDGNYKLVATQTLSDLPGDASSPTIDPVTLEFSVRGPRFKLNPADIHSVFPPPGPPTPYEGQIPHVVVTRKTLPWERLLASGQRGVPWLGLLTVYEKDTGGIPKVQSGTLADLLKDGGKLPQGTVGPALTKADLDDGESVQDPCSFVDLPVDLFAAIAPRADELPFLAHARGVDTGNKPIEGIIADGIYSVLIGNRVTFESALHGVFLVSFEGLESLLTGVPVSGYNTVRLAVLYSWLFQMGGDDPFDVLMSADHSGLLAIHSPDVTVESQSQYGEAQTQRAESGCLPFLGLVPRVAGQTPVQHRVLTISPPKPGSPTFAEDTVSYALQSGYAALLHDLREGGETYSWYRGPLIPYLLGLVLGEGHSVPVARAADQLLRYNPESGLFDTTYAAAFQLGRLLALQNEAFASALRAYLHQVKGQALRLASRKELAEQKGSPLELPAAGSELMRNSVVLDGAVRWLAVHGSDTLSAAVTGSLTGGNDHGKGS